MALTVVLTLALAAAACTTSDDSADTTTTSAASSSGSETTPTTAGRPEEPTTSETEEDVEAAVRAAHTFFMVDFFARDEREQGVEPFLDLANEILTGPVLARTEESGMARIASGERISSPGYDSNIEIVEIDGDSAKVLDCSRDLAVLYSSAGEPLNTLVDEFMYRETWLVRADGRWLVEELFTGGDLACDPSDVDPS
ncbi:MAG: hypothetical protein AAF962_13455 [Actinomycetota bacterium]